MCLDRNGFWRISLKPKTIRLVRIASQTVQAFGDGIDRNRQVERSLGAQRSGRLDSG